MIKYMVGKSTIKLGSKVCLSPRGFLKPWDSRNQCLGTAITILRAGKIAVDDTDGKEGLWRDPGQVNPRLTEISMSYFKED